MFDKVDDAVGPLLNLINDPQFPIRHAAISLLGSWRVGEAVPELAKLLVDAKNSEDRVAAAEALGKINNPVSSEALKRLLEGDAAARHLAVAGLSQTLDQTARKLLSRDFDAGEPWLDPKQAITDERIAEASAELDMPAHDIRALYASLARQFGLKFASSKPASINQIL
jgi:HEAT repeat protein